MRTGSRVAILLTLAAVAACASGTAGKTRPAGRDRYVIRYDELRESNGTDLFTTVVSLRPFWLNKRGSQSGEVVVYVDNMRYGTARSLGLIDVSTVEWLEYMTGPEASARLGRGHPHGAILVHTRRGGPESD